MKNFCVLPFFGKEYSFDRPAISCCLLKHQNIDQIKQEMLKDTRSSACNSCWKLEDQQLLSDRQLKNSAYDFYADKDIRYVIDEVKVGKYSDQIVKLYTSSLCNSTCVTCNSKFSTSWAQLEGNNTKASRLDNDIIDSIDYKNLKMLTFVGGEPLYEKKNFEVLQRLLDAGNSKCFISFTTNGSVELTAHQQNMLSQFANVNFCISVDGIGSVFEYLRFPLKWDSIIKTISTCRSINIEPSISYTISNLNILYYKETIDWFNEQKLNYNHNLVNTPSYFSVNALPAYIKDTITDGKELLRNHSITDDTLFLKFIDEINRQDLLKKINIEDYLPKLAALIRN